MPLYTIDSLRTALGERPFMALADLDRDGVLGIEEAARVERLILVGQADIDTRMRGKFRALTNTPPEYMEAVLDCIVYRLQPRGKVITADAESRFKTAIQWAKDVKADEAQITTDEQPALRRTHAASQTGPGRKFTTTKLRDVL
jgi:phage gp36-like protein